MSGAPWSGRLLAPARSLDPAMKALLLAGLCALAWLSQAEAPDGRPGLGKERSAREYERVFLSPSESDQHLLRDLAELESDLRVLVEMARRDYRRRGYLRWVGGLAPVELHDLHAAYRAATRDGLVVAMEGGPRGEVWSEMFVDLRFRARMELMEDFEREAREVRGGMALLRALQDGYVEMKDGEAREVAARVDLAAALLRAIRSDLEALRERGDPDAPGNPDPAWKVELIGLTQLRDPAERERAYQDLARRLDERQAELEAVLFTPRLRQRLDASLRRREVLRERARALLDEAKIFLLELPEGEDPPPELARMTQTARFHQALRRLVDGIGHDPLNPELALRAGRVTDQLYDGFESRQWYDRFLALRGIRLHLSGTTEGQLDEDEREALGVLMRGGPLGR